MNDGLNFDWLRRARKLARTATRRVRGRHPAVPGLPATTWIRAEPNPAKPDTLESFRFFAILGTWYEADVVEATVRNALAQGCERVYLVDNDSPDDTVDRAVSAGATLARTFTTDEYDEALRIDLMNEVVEEVSTVFARDEGATHIWWLWSDADEFHHGPHGQTVREYLAGLDRRFRVVGARFFNHYPDAVPEYVEGRHPLDYQPMCEEYVYPMCKRGHRKHPLQRWDLGAAPVVCGPGFHQASCAGGQLIEPLQHIYLHHFPFRVESISRRRLELLCAPDHHANPRALDRKVHAHLHNRLTSFNAVYRHDWEAVENFLPARGHRGIFVEPWSTQVPAADQSFARWY